MIYGVYVIRDNRTSFLTPSVDFNDASATRNFEHAVQQRESLFFTHPEDYALYKIGEFDTEIGIITPITPVVLCNGNAF